MLLLGVVVGACVFGQAVALLLPGEEEAPTADDTFLLAAEEATALIPLAADSLGVPDDHGQKDGHDNTVEHNNADAGEDAERSQGGQGL